MRLIAFVLVQSLSVAFAGAAYAAPGGGSYEPTVPPSNDAQMEADLAEAEYLVKSEKYAEAIPVLNKVVARKANHADALNYLGLCHRKLGQRAQAKTYYDKALAADPQHKGAHEYLGELYLQLDDLAKAEAQLAVLKGLCPAGCSQLDDLDVAIQDYKSGKKP